MRYLPKKYRIVFQAFLLLLALAALERYDIQIEILAGAIGLVLGLILLISYLKLKTFEVGSFARAPQEYHREFIEIEGKIVKVFGDSVAERMRRKAVDRWRDFTGNSDSRGRYVHQRFLITSKDLFPGETLLVEHNEEFGLINISRGDRVKLKGEYIHPAGKSRHRYGRVHKTHNPGGWVEVVS